MTDFNNFDQAERGARKLALKDHCEIFISRNSSNRFDYSYLPRQRGMRPYAKITRKGLTMFYAASADMYVTIPED